MVSEVEINHIPNHTMIKGAIHETWLEKKMVALKIEPDLYKNKNGKILYSPTFIEDTISTGSMCCDIKLN